MMIGFDVAPVAPSARLVLHQIGVHRIEPQLGAGGDQRLQVVMSLLAPYVRLLS